MLLFVLVNISNIYNDLVLSLAYNYRLAKPLDGKGDEDETIEDQEEVYKGHFFAFLSPSPRLMRRLTT